MSTVTRRDRAMDIGDGGVTYLHLADLAPATFIATEADEAGQRVRDLAHVNLERIIWIESEPAAATLRFQIDRDSWLRVAFPTPEAFRAASDRLDALLGLSGS
jgi:hypothetical protein